MSIITPLHYSSYYSTMEKEEQNALVFFSSPQCSSCRYLKQKLLEQDISIPLFEIDASSALGLVEDFQIFHLPTVILYAAGQFHRFFSPNLQEPIEKQITESYLLPPHEDPSCSQD